MRLSALLIFGLLLSLALESEAQPPPYSIGVAFDPSGTLYEGVVPGFAAPTRLYFLVLGMTEPIAGYENGVTISGPGHEGWIITRGTPAGVDMDPDPDSYVVELGECVEGESQRFVINTYDFALFDSPLGPQDTLVCVGPRKNSEPAIPGHPSYRTCSGQVGVSTGQPCHLCLPDVPDGCSVINPTIPPSCGFRWCDPVVSTESTSWSSLKSKY